MQNLISYKSLAKLSFYQTKRSKSKSEIFRFVFIFVFFWILEVIGYFMMMDKNITIPINIIISSCLLLAIPDFILKLIFVHSDTVMNAFLKTRPITQEMWNKHLAISQFWKLSNLEIPMILLPVCFFYMPLSIGICVWITTYLLSVFGGFLVNIIKRRGTYQKERATKANHLRNTNSVRGKNIFGIQIRSLFRSKRLRNQMIVMMIVFVFNAFTQSINPRMADMTTMKNITILMFIALFQMVPTQFGFGIESNFFNGIWTKPLTIRRLLCDKYRFCMIIGGICSIFCIPFCFFSDLQILSIISYFLYSTGFGGLIMLIDPYKCVPFEMFGNVFFNYQGSSSAYKISVLGGIIVILGIGVAAFYFLPEWIVQISISALGIICLCIHKHYFKWVENNFLKNRYKYMEKYKKL